MSSSPCSPREEVRADHRADPMNGRAVALRIGATLAALIPLVGACSAELSLGPEVESYLLELSGTVVSTVDAEPVPNVSLLVCGPTPTFGFGWCRGSTTDAEGRYQLSEEVQETICPIDVTTLSTTHLNSSSDVRCGPGAQTVDLQIVPHSSLRIKVAPDSARIGVGTPVRFDAEVFDPGRGRTVDIEPDWTSLSPEVAEIDRNGSALGLAPGIALIEASLTGTADTAVLVVAEPPSDPTGPVAFVEHRSGVTRVDLETALAVGPATTMPAYTNDIVAHPDGTRMYVVGAAGITVLDGASGEIRTTIPMSGGTRSLALTPDGTQALATSDSSNVVARVDLATETVVGEIPTPGRPFGVTIASDGARAWVSHLDSRSIRALDVATGMPVGEDIVFGSRPQALAVTPDGSKVYAALHLAGVVAVIDAATGTVTDSVDVRGKPVDLVFSQDGSRLFVSNLERSSVTVIDTASDAKLSSISLPAPAFGLSLTPDGTTLVAALFSMDALVFIDAATGALIEEPVPVGRAPDQVAIRGPDI